MTDRERAEREARNPLTEFAPFQVGDEVCVNVSCKYAGEWPGTYVVTGIVWDYRGSGRLNIWIASQGEIDNGYGDTDGWNVEDLNLVRALRREPSNGN